MVSCLPSLCSHTPSYPSASSLPFTITPCSTVHADWSAPLARGPLEGLRGSVDITRDALSLSLSSAAFDLTGSAATTSPPIIPSKRRPSLGPLRPWPLLPDQLPPPPPRPTVDSIEGEMRLRAFDALGLVPAGTDPLPPPSPTQLHLKMSGKVKLAGQVQVKREGGGMDGEAKSQGEGVGAPVKGSGSAKGVHASDGGPRFAGEVSLQGIRVNQLLLGANIAGHVHASPTSLELRTTGVRTDEAFHLRLHSSNSNNHSHALAPAAAASAPSGATAGAAASKASSGAGVPGAGAGARGNASGSLRGSAALPASDANGAPVASPAVGPLGGSLLLQRGQMRVEAALKPHSSAKLQVGETERENRQCN